MHFECLGISIENLLDCIMNRNYFLRKKGSDLLDAVLEGAGGGIESK